MDLHLRIFTDKANLGLRTFVILLAGACGMACLLALLPAAGHDQMWLLYAAGLHLHGAAFYGPEIFETNPPLILWMSLIPAALSNLTHLSATTWGKLLVVLIEGSVGAFCWRLLRKIRPRLGAGANAALAFAFVVIFAVLPARDFGQRDHLLILLILPYLAAAAVRASGGGLKTSTAWLIGVVGLVGIALKPQEVVVIVAVELWLMAVWKRRERFPLLRPELLGFLLGGGVFLGAVAVFTPLYLPLLGTLRDSYWAYGQLSVPRLLGESLQLHGLLLIDLALASVVGWRRLGPVVTVLLVAGIASTVAYYLQGTGWYYQQLPALSLLALGLTFLLIELAERRQWTVPRWAPAAATGLCLLALGLTAHFMDYPFTAARSFPVNRPDPSFFAELPAGSAVMTISPTVDDTIQPIFKYHLTLGQRYPAFLLLPALLRSEDPQGKPSRHQIPPDRLAALERIQYAYMHADLTRWKPALLLVERCEDPAVRCQTLEDRHDNLLKYFLRDAAFASLFSQYRYLRSSGPYDAYGRR